MPFTFNTPADQAAMLAAIGVDSIEELFDSIPEAMRLKRPLDIAPAMGELELTQHMGKLAAKNLSTDNSVCFLGGGSYDHFIPAVVVTLASRGEFYTSYTPYQPEVSQGNLQAMFEYQTLICQLTGMDVSNASLYDGGTATLEAILLCLATAKGRRKVVVAESLHPEYRQILSTYFDHLDVVLATAPSHEGRVAPADMLAEVDGNTACIVVQHPNFFGCLEEMQSLVDVARAAGALVVHVFDPVSLGVLKRPGDFGVDVAVAEGQSLGNPMAFGGPYLGIMACREQFVRRMPGRIAGQTTDRRGKRCYVLTLQTREQHIRREKATSNICTNQGLFALRSSIYLTALGPRGLASTAELCLQKSHYAIERITASDRFELAFAQPTFKEFVIRDRENRVEEAIASAAARRLLAGVPLAPWFPQLADCFLVAVTEKRTREEIETLAELLTHSHAHAEPTYA
ncbi:MAG: aminomethyl-transferring glycine dehydrogenase subunit GcvPA [Planctomycetales bacterium]|nr:aminomethyl-transferring glycine dehydrogenase subunit GcvPA [Planctomycetales bacterium]